MVCQLCKSRGFVLFSILLIAVSLAPRTEYPELCAWHIMVVNKYLSKKEGWKEGQKGDREEGKMEGGWNGDSEGREAGQPLRAFGL